MILDDRADPLIFCTPLLAESGNWLEGGRRWSALWRVSQSGGLVHPALWTLVLSWRSSIYPSSLSSSACPMPCISHCSPNPTGGRCLPACPTCLGYCFLPDLPFLVALLSRGDYHSILCCPICHGDLQDVVCSSGLAIAPTLSYTRRVVQLSRPGFALVSPRN